MQPRSIALPGRRSTLVYRTGSGPPLVWLHGLYGVEPDGPVIERLASRYDVIAPLAPGFADLDELDDLRDIHDLALHYDDILEALGLSSVSLAGHSFGAMIAAEIAAHVPMRVAKLVLLSPLGLWNDSYPVADLWGIPPEEAPRLLYAKPPPVQEAPATPDVETVMARARGMASVARFLWPVPDRGLVRRLHRVRAPTLVVHGALDAFVPVQYASEFVTRLPDAKLRIIDGAGHMLPVEAGETVAEALLDFLPARLEVGV